MNFIKSRSPKHVFSGSARAYAQFVGSKKEQHIHNTNKRDHVNMLKEHVREILPTHTTEHMSAALDKQMAHTPKGKYKDVATLRLGDGVRWPKPPQHARGDVGKVCMGADADPNTHSRCSTKRPSRAHGNRGAPVDEFPEIAANATSPRGTRCVIRKNRMYVDPDGRSGSYEAVCCVETSRSRFTLYRNAFTARLENVRFTFVDDIYAEEIFTLLKNSRSYRGLVRDSGATLELVVSLGRRYSSPGKGHHSSTGITHVRGKKRLG